MVSVNDYQDPIKICVHVMSQDCTLTITVEAASFGYLAQCTVMSH